jgi:hypothetical protein
MKQTKLCKVCGKTIYLDANDFSAKANWKRRKYCSETCRHSVSNAAMMKRRKQEAASGFRKPAVFTDIHNKIIYGR